MDKTPGMTASGPGTSSIADMLKPKRSRAEKAALKKQNLAHSEIIKQETPVYRERLQDPQSEKQADYLELGLILDATKSMKPWINRAKETLTEIIDSVVAESKDEGENPLIVRVCFIGFRDHKDDERFSICPFTEDIQVIKDFMKNCSAEGGKDIPEDVVGGLKMCLMQDWTSDSIKKVFMIGDAPCHGKQYTGDLDDHYPEGSPEGLTVETLMKEYCKQDIEFSMIKLNNSVDTMIQAMRKHHQEIDIKDMSIQTAQKVLADHIINMPASSSYDKPADYYLGSGFGMTPGAGITAGASLKDEAESMAMMGSSSYGCYKEDAIEDMDACDDSISFLPVETSMAKSKSERLARLRKAKAERDGAKMSRGAAACMAPSEDMDMMMDRAMDREFASYAIKKTGAAIKNYRAKKKM